MSNEQILLSALGVTLGIVGFLIKYIFSSHNKKIDELKENCAKVAEKVQSNVDELEKKMDSKALVLDADIKKVGRELSVQVQEMTNNIFARLDKDRLEHITAINMMNGRFDSLLLSLRIPNQGN